LAALFEKERPRLEPLGVSAEATSRLIAFLEKLKAWNAHTNLISFTDDEELFWSHAVDSLMVLSLAGAAASARAIDVGTGGGFPGMPIALARPDWRVTLLDSVGKKVDFLRAAASELGAANVDALSGRAEELARLPEHRASYDLAFCRAVGNFSVVLELTLPFLKTGGALLAHRGEDGPDEAGAAASALTLLGGAFRNNFSYRLPHRDKTRHILRVEKTAPTPDAYPRRAGMPAKRPL